MRNRIVDLIEQEAAADEKVVFLTGDLGYSVIERIRSRLGERFINAGVSEANMASMAGAMSLAGLRPYIYSIAPFVTLRCIEQIRNDICYQGRNVRIVGVGAGFSYGTLGPSHHALEDAAILGSLPGMTVLCPAGIGELDALFAAYVDHNEPIYFRIGRERGPNLSPPHLTREASAWVLREGKDATALCSGAIIEKALEAANKLAGEGVSLRVVSMPVMHPFLAAAVAPLVRGPIVTVVEAYGGNPLEHGGMRLALDARTNFAAVNIVQDFPHVVGSHETLRATCGINVDTIMGAVRACLG